MREIPEKVDVPFLPGRKSIFQVQSAKRFEIITVTGCVISIPVHPNFPLVITPKIEDTSIATINIFDLAGEPEAPHGLRLVEE